MINQTYADTEVISLIEGIMQLLASVYQVATTNFTSFDINNENAYYIMNNGDDVIMIALLNSALFYMNVTDLYIKT